MKVIICGAGRVGYGIAERLAAEENDVSVIDTSADLIQGIRDTLDVRGFVGHGAETLRGECARVCDREVRVAVAPHAPS